MTKDQKLGQVRALLTALSGVLIAWGINDGHGWMPVVGIVLALYSLIAGIRAHLDKSKPGGVAWSLVRKLVNVAGAAAVTYGVTSPEQSESLGYLFAAVGPLIAGLFSFIDNDADTGPSDFGGYGPSPVILLLLALGAFFLSGCGIRFTEDGCILGQYERNGHAYYAGPCVGPDIDGDGESDVDRFRVQWANGGGDQIRATYSTASSSVLVEYQAENGNWIVWSSKSGVQIGPVPPEVEKALEGQPEPIDRPAILPPLSMLPTGDHHEGDDWRRKWPVMISSAGWPSLVTAPDSCSGIAGSNPAPATIS